MPAANPTEERRKPIDWRADWQGMFCEMKLSKCMVTLHKPPAKPSRSARITTGFFPLFSIDQARNPPVAAARRTAQMRSGTDRGGRPPPTEVSRSRSMGSTRSTPRARARTFGVDCARPTDGMVDLFLHTNGEIGASAWRCIFFSGGGQLRSSRNPSRSVRPCVCALVYPRRRPRPDLESVLTDLEGSGRLLPRQIQNSTAWRDNNRRASCANQPEYTQQACVSMTRWNKSNSISTLCL